MYFDYPKKYNFLVLMYSVFLPVFFHYESQSLCVFSLWC
jgi:hypothetical protein